MRAPGAIFNTHIKSVKGMISKGSIIPKKARVVEETRADRNEAN